MSFPRGDQGWYNALHHVEEHQTATRTKITMQQFYCYQMGKNSALLRKLFCNKTTNRCYGSCYKVWHTFHRLAVHLPEQQRVYYSEVEEALQLIEQPRQILTLLQLRKA